jgi:hypothetical protein
LVFEFVDELVNPLEIFAFGLPDVYRLQSVGVSC